ncbi:MAG: hypothetical protein AB7S38_28870 [Vulcanimicrobiota bacterium]
MSKSYLEKHFITECKRWLLPYYADRKTKRLHMHPLLGEPVWTGPGWRTYRPPDLPKAMGLRFSIDNPCDLMILAGVERRGVKVAESHAVEAKLVKNDTSFALSEIRTHQWDAMVEEEAQGVNGFGWLLVQFLFLPGESSHLLPEGRATWLVRVHHLLELRRLHRGHLTVGMCRRVGTPVPFVRLPKVQNGEVKGTREAWDLSGLVTRQTERTSA